MGMPSHGHDTALGRAWPAYLAQSALDPPVTPHPQTNWEGYAWHWNDPTRPLACKDR